MFRKKAIWSFLLVLMLSYALLLTGCTSSEPAAGSITEMPETIRLAVTDIQGLEELQRDFGYFREALETALGTKVEFFPVSDRGAAVAALQTDQVDLVFTGPAEYVVIKTKTEAIPVIGITRPDYRSLIIVHADSPYQSVADLKGKKIAMSDVGSTSGHLGPSKLLVDAGLKPGTDIEALTLGDNFLPAFKNRDVDALGCNKTDLALLQQELGVKAEEVRILEEGPLLPNDVFVLNKKYSQEVAATIREKMKAHESELINAILRSNSGDTMKYQGSELVAADDQQYDYVREMYQAIGVDDFSEFVGD